MYKCRDNGLKKSFSFILVCNLASKDIAEPFIGQNIFVFKVPFVGTLNLCLRMPDTEQKTRVRSDHPGLRYGPKTAEKPPICISANFKQFLDVFSAQDDRIEFLSFSLCQAS